MSLTVRGAPCRSRCACRALTAPGPASPRPPRARSPAMTITIKQHYKQQMKYSINKACLINKSIINIVPILLEHNNAYVVATDVP